jgi:hypothetical protein
METRKKRSHIVKKEIFLTVLLVLFYFRGIMLTLHEADVVLS